MKSRLALQMITWNLWSLSWATKIKSTNIHPTSESSILILSSHLGLHFSNSTFTWKLHTIPFSAFGPKPRNLTCFSWCTFLHVAVVPTSPVHHFFCTAELCCPHSSEFCWILLSCDTHAACSSLWLRARTIRHVCPSQEGSELTNGGVCGALHAR
jgi:hypothetical protein